MKNEKVVILTGAGISAESGFKTFRDSDGLWEYYNVYDVATPEAWDANPSLVLEFYNARRRQVLEAKPNKAHQLLALLEDYFPTTIITQNIDNLHERAGSSNVLHLHGEIMKARSSVNPLELTDVDPENPDINYGDKSADGSQLRPDVVWFGEPVPAMEQAMDLASEADIFIIVGTSLMVYPAASLIEYVSKTCKIYLIDSQDVFIRGFEHRVVKIIKPASVGCENLLQILLKDVE